VYGCGRISALFRVTGKEFEKMKPSISEARQWKEGEITEMSAAINMNEWI
jgi:hypothetical protein